ncbi:hypothetical protein BDW02DRAFT_576945 [Decorospora gaudefroyi]|uniref:F-box domain-containing protein n=1 Tax=Decorospora gaudefroyi TaxID=184978 RepID=A0A6A5KVI2_9PLEO|nr:hypothetical protein BDW02DRAFT_576945 [Decorospora gaudefroyi]
MTNPRPILETQSDSPLLKLPAELRNQIYEYILSPLHTQLNLCNPSWDKRYSAGFAPWLNTFTLSSVCHQLRTEYRPLALRAQNILLDRSTFPRYLHSVYATPEDVSHSPQHLSLFLLNPREHLLVFDLWPLLRFHHLASPGRSSVTIRPGGNPGRKRIRHIVEFLKHDDPRWIGQLRSGNITSVMLHARGCPSEYGSLSGLTRIVIVFHTGSEPPYLTEEVVLPDFVVCHEGVLDRFGHYVGFAKRPRLDIHAAVEGRCNLVWPRYPMS